MEHFPVRMPFKSATAKCSAVQNAYAIHGVEHGVVVIILCPTHNTASAVHYPFGVIFFGRASQSKTNDSTIICIGLYCMPRGKCKYCYPQPSHLMSLR